MEILGVGPLEFIFFLIIALLVLGPEGMLKASRSVAQFIRGLITSPTWRTVQDVQREMQTLPTQLMREAGLDEIKDEIPDLNEIGKEAGLDQLQQDVNKLKADLSGWSSDAPTIQPLPKPPPVTLPGPGVAYPPGAVPVNPPESDTSSPSDPN